MSKRRGLVRVELPEYSPFSVLPLLSARSSLPRPLSPKQPSVVMPKLENGYGALSWRGRVATLPSGTQLRALGRGWLPESSVGGGGCGLWGQDTLHGPEVSIPVPRLCTPPQAQDARKKRGAVGVRQAPHHGPPADT